MHSSIIITSLFAALAVATPVHQALHKKAIVWDVVTDIVTVTVTAGDLPETVRVKNTVYVNPVAAPTSAKVKSSKTRRPRPTTTSSPPPTPPTTTSTTTTTPPPPPPPSTTQAPVPTTTPAPAPIVAPTIKSVAPAETKAAVVEPSTAGGSASGSTSSTGDKVKDAALNFHNAKRALHHVGSVSWDDALAADAATLAKTCTNVHAIYGSYGQNIAASAVSNPASPSDDLAKIMNDAAASWYNEVTDFASMNLFGKSDMPTSLPSGVQLLHFTQLVWKATTQIGCAVNYCGTDGNIFPAQPPFTFYAYTIVCNYKAAGNVGGAYASNVFAA